MIADHLQIDTLTLAWATHRLGGVQTPANAAYSAAELEYQLRDSGARCLFTCLPLLELSLQAAKAVGMPRERIYLLEVTDSATGGQKTEGFKTADDLINEGKNLPRLEELNWTKGEGARRSAFLCYSSGTSGLPVRTDIACVLALQSDSRVERCYDLTSQCYCKRSPDEDI